MTKPGLGRGLGQLLKDAKVEPPPSVGATEREPVSLTTGMKTLIRGNNLNQTLVASYSVPRSVAYSLLAADISLCLLAWRLMNQSNSVANIDGVLALGAVLLAGWLGWLAIKIIVNSFDSR